MRFVIKAIGLLLLFTATKVVAYTGICTPYPDTKQFVFDFKPSMLNVSLNKPDTLVGPVGRWNLGEYYAVTCDCPTSLIAPVYYKAVVSSNLIPTASRNGYNYYYLNKYLEVATDVYIAGNSRIYAPTPFTDYSNTLNAACSGYDVVDPSISSGSSGTVALYIRRPFVGQVDIPLTKILDIYGTRVRSVYGPKPQASVYFRATITVPQNCTINAGQIININFEDISSLAISKKNQSGVAEKQVNMTLNCSNLTTTEKISLSFSGQNSSSDSTALATNNPDIGIRVKDSNNKIITPNQDTLPVTMNSSAAEGTATMYLSPINTSGNTPKLGQFNAVATLNAEIN